MPQNDDFAVFVQDGQGPMWRESCSDLETAKTKAKQLALDEGLEFFVFDFKDYTEVARFFPNPNAVRRSRNLECGFFESLSAVSPTSNR